MNELKFNSQICTSVEQSERLLELGLKSETADMCFFRSTDEDLENPYTRLVVDDYILNALEDDNNIPAWSLSRLCELIPTDILYENIWWSFVILDKCSFQYENMDINRTIITFNNENLFECAIDCLEWLINENILKQEYLKQ